MTLPGLLLLGAPKCGTSTLAAWWDAHPQGYTAPAKEVGFFWPDYDRGLDWYRTQFAGAAPGQVTCDASPGYMYFDEALDRIKADLPDARLALVLREPVSRVWSHWCYMVALGLEPRPFAKVLDQEEQDEGVTPPGFPLGYVAMSRYARPVASILQRFGRDQLLVMLTDELRDDPEGTFARLCAHGGIGPGEPEGARNEGRFPRSPRLQRSLFALRASRWPAGLGRRLMLANLREGPPPPLPKPSAARLSALLSPELPALEELLQRRLPASWRR
ncbi:MAG TPA: sulfotransferase domain-containing protein [Mycobacteriales bacterium]|nr:sulfotransferase domain-containing protein [Mycobacteriales bacterium]